MKKFANAEIEVVKFDNAVIATSGCTNDVTGASNYAFVYSQYLGSAQFNYGESFDSYLGDEGGYFDLGSNTLMGPWD